MKISKKSVIRPSQRNVERQKGKDRKDNITRDVAHEGDLPQGTQNRNTAWNLQQRIRTNSKTLRVAPRADVSNYMYMITR